jgi:hypothetical protein
VPHRSGSEHRHLLEVKSHPRPSVMVPSTETPTLATATEVSSTGAGLIEGPGK